MNSIELAKAWRIYRKRSEIWHGEPDCVIWTRQRTSRPGNH